MAKKPKMIECPTCEKNVSVTATSCPSCGAVLRKPKRGIFGKLSVFVFWAFNALMVVTLISGIQTTSESGQALTGAEEVGHAIGAGIGFTMILGIWVIGAVILGLMALLTRPRS